MEDQHLIPEPQHLKTLRRLVTVLLVIMIFGFLIIVALFAIRLGGQADTNLTLPAEITLPAGITALSYTKGPDWYAITGSDNIIRIYNPDHSLRQEIQIKQN